MRLANSIRLKADGCDIVSGLEESLRHERTHEWNGDIDCGMPEVEILYSLYIRRLESLDNMVSDTRRQLFVETLRLEHCTLITDITFIAKCEHK